MPDPDDQVRMLRTAAVAVQRGLEVHFEVLADDLGSTPYRVRFTATGDPTIFWTLHGELHPGTVWESEAWGRGRPRR